MQWPHAPAHHFDNESTFFITGATYQKQLFYRDEASLDELQAILFDKAKEHGCWLQAWCLMANHYHVVIRGGRVREFIHRFHTVAALALNARDRTPYRRVWFQYWDKTLTFEASWLARLRYTQENAVHHGVARVATEYRWCSARAFEESAPRSFVQTVRRMKTDRLRVYDPFDSGGFATALLNMQERRRAERFPITIPVELKGGSGITRDVSGLGVSFRAPFPFERDEEVEFLLRIPGSVHVQCRGRVVRVSHDRESMMYDVGMTIDDYDVDDADQQDTKEAHIVVRELRKHQAEKTR
jgi:putative transposase